jgi:hypothetical protein
VPATTLGLYLALGIAAVTGLQAIITTVITNFSNSRKEKRDAERAIKAAEISAKLKSEEKAEDWKRQDEVAKRVSDAALQTAETAKLLLDSQAAAIKRQNEVADQVAITAKQAATTAELLVQSQKSTNARQDEVAGLVADAAKQARGAAALLVEAQDRSTKQLADAADLLVKATADTNARTDEVARIAAENDKRVQAQLIAIDEQGRKIHILVNSDMTAARTAERDSLKLLVISLKNALALSIKLGVQLTGTEQEEIEKIEKRILELDQILADRHAAQLVVEAEARESGTHAAPTVEGVTPLQRDQNSRPSTSVVMDGSPLSVQVAENTKNIAALKDKQ